MKKFDYFNLGNSFALYYLFIFGTMPMVGVLKKISPHINTFVNQALQNSNYVMGGKVMLYLSLGIAAFLIGYHSFTFRPTWFSRLGLDKTWRDKNTIYVFAVLLFSDVFGKIMMLLDGRYYQVFNITSPFQNTEFRSFIGYFEILGLATLAVACAYYFYLLKNGDPRYKIWRRISWFTLILETTSGFLTANRLPVITVMMVYAIARHYCYKKSWKHFVAVLLFSVFIVMPGGSIYERPNDFRSFVDSKELKGQARELKEYVIDASLGRFSQNVVISSIIEKTTEFSYGRNLLNFFVSLGPPRFIWKNKPILGFPGNEFGRKYGIINDFDLNTNVGPTVVGDLYMNFGLSGIVGGLFVLGCMLKFAYNLFITHSKIALSGIMIYSAIWPGIIKGIENDVALVLAGSVKLAAFMFFIHLCLTVDWGRLMARIAKFWRPLVFGIFIWLFMGDTVRKLIPAQPWQLMLVLDMTLLFAYVLFAVDHLIKKKPFWHPSFLIPFIVFGIVFLASVFGPYSAGLGAGLVGFRSYFWFIPLMFLGYEMFNHKEQVSRFCRILSYAAIPLLILAGIQQIFHGSDIALLNPFIDGVKFHSGGANIGLVSSVFGSAQRFGMVSMFLFFLGVAVKSPATLFAFASIILSGSRSAFVLSVFGCVVLLFLGRKQLSTKASYFKITLGALVVVALLWSIPSFRNTTLFQLKDGIPMISSSRLGVFAGEMKEVWGKHVSWFGKGAGAFSQGVDYIGKRQALSLEKSLGETGIRNLLFEMGMVGLMAFYAMWASLILTLRKGLKTIEDPTLKAISFAIAIFAVSVLLRFTFMHGQTLNDYAVLVPLWFFLGVFFRMKSYEDTSHSAHVSPRL